MDLRGQLMDICQVPFNHLIGLEPEDPASGLLISLPESPRYQNHLGTVHGSALLAVAEAGSGVFLLRHFGQWQGFVPVVRKLEAKFRKPASGRISSRCSIPREVADRWSSELMARGRVSVSIPIEVIDSKSVVVVSAAVEWFITRTS